jgi:hypothetical protein
MGGTVHYLTWFLVRPATACMLTTVAQDDRVTSKPEYVTCDECRRRMK